MCRWMWMPSSSPVLFPRPHHQSHPIVICSFLSFFSANSQILDLHVFPKGPDVYV
ncbi:unnamed protein product, partial [Prunus brigantina]